MLIILQSQDTFAQGKEWNKMKYIYCDLSVVRYVISAYGVKFVFSFEVT